MVASPGQSPLAALHHALFGVAPPTGPTVLVDTNAPQPVPASVHEPLPQPAVALASQLVQLSSWGGRAPTVGPTLSKANATAAAATAAAQQQQQAVLADALTPAVAAAAMQPLHNGRHGATSFSTKGGSGAAAFAAPGRRTGAS